MKYNKKTDTSVTNLAGGKAFDLDSKQKLATLVLTSFIKDQFYKSENATQKELIKLIDKVPEFALKLAVYARKEHGMRTVTHIMASHLAQFLSGKKYGAMFYHDVVRRPDDIIEIIAYHFSKKQKLTNAMRKGFAKRLAEFNDYQLAKYKAEGHAINMFDVVNLVHAKSVTIDKLMKGELKQHDTWEDMLSKAGSDKEAKAKVWQDLLGEDKIGYFAALRNIRNIHNQAPETEDKLIEILTDENRIKKSLVLPFRFSTAYGMVEELNSANHLLKALSQAIEISLNNVPKFDGKTLVVLDESGSMSGRPAEIGALFASVLVKTNDADLMTFSDDARYRSINPSDSLFSIVKSIGFRSGGTNLASVFNRIDKKYDRIIVLSDFQTWMETGGWYYGDGRTFNQLHIEYEKKYGKTKVYSWDLQGYGTTQIPKDEVFLLAGFSDRVFDIMKLLESDRQALINLIEEY